MSKLHNQLGMLSTEWDTEQSNLYTGSYLFNYGISHLLRAGQYNIVTSLLNDERYLITRLRVLNSSGVQRLYRDISASVRFDTSLAQTLKKWNHFFEANTYLLQRGNDVWSADRIFVQRLFETTEEALSSRATRLAEEQSFRILCSKPYPEISSGKILLDGYLDVYHGDVLAFDNCMVAW